MKRLLLFAITLFLITQLQAQGWGQTQKIVPNDRSQGQQFGADVAIDGNYAVVGVLVSGTAKDAYVFENDGNGNWVQLQKLESPNFNQFDHFGTAVDISGDYILLGAWGQSYNANDSNFIQGAGAGYIFKKQASGLFEFEQKIVASDREINNHFGISMSINGDYAIIGALRQAYDVTGNNYIQNAGAAYIFERNGSGDWIEVQKIVASDRGETDYFAGDSVSINGNYVLVGAKYEDEDTSGMNTFNAAGSAYVFERDGSGTWIEVQKIVASNRQGNELFGGDVSINGNYLVVGAEEGNVIGNYTGSVYVFERVGTGTWNETQEITASDGSYLSRFGKSLSFDGNHILVGADLEEIGAVGDGGAAYVFEKDGSGFWNETAIMYDPDAHTSDYFGFSVAISGDYSFVGAYEEDEDENNENTVSGAGSVYIFNVNEPNNLSPLNTLSVVRSDFESTIKAYPNPVLNNLYLDFNQNFNQVTITINNVFGQQVFVKNYSNTESIELPFDFAKGIYIVEVNIENKDASVLKIIKH